VRQHEQAQYRKRQRQNPTEAYLSAKPAPHASNTIYQLPFLKLQSIDYEHLAMSDPALRSPRNFVKIQDFAFSSATYARIARLMLSDTGTPTSA